MPSPSLKLITFRFNLPIITVVTEDFIEKSYLVAKTSNNPVIFLFLDGKKGFNAMMFHILKSAR